MIGFTTVAETIDFSGIDTLMFTSKQAVKVADQIDQKWKEYPSIAIGNATKKQIEDLGGEVIYQPQHFYGEVLSQDIAMFFRERKILYLRPNEVSFDAKTFLAKQGIRLFEQIIYETTCVKYDKEDMPQKDAVIIFTSPSTIHCFFRNFSWDPSYTAVVIGEATKVHLPKGARYAVAKEPLIASCIEKAEEILLSSNSK
ncbi:uroporphyrinogen-III synthase [Sulfurovum indicum]|uniref:Uroporphyrinogen-III synthase n=2 Tax=Sulfurovaceae TaxID=2771472 RepID=A0A7M1S769_9BACT|nr:uroporphyrinogen-III synthase [Sulfurovum indicum]